MTATAGLEPLAHGWPLRPEVKRRRFPSDKRAASTKRERSLGLDARSRGWTVYVAVTPCGRFLKIGFSGNPVGRVKDGVRIGARRRGWGAPVLIRLYGGGPGLERECLDFMEPDRVLDAPSSEWFRVGPRFRVLLNRLDREERRLP